MKIELDLNIEEAVYWATSRRRSDKTAGAQLQNMVIMAAEEACVNAGVQFTDWTEVWILRDKRDPVYEEMYYDYKPAAEAARQLCHEGREVTMRRAERTVR